MLLADDGLLPLLGLDARTVFSGFTGDGVVCAVVVFVWLRADRVSTSLRHKA